MVESSTRRFSLWWLILLLIALAILIYFCLAERFDIQSKVQANATKAIEDAGLTAPVVTADGRDITLSGVVDRTVNLDALKNAAEEGDGVRNVYLDVSTQAAQPANVTLDANGNTAVVSGTVSSDQERSSIIEVAQSIYTDGVEDKLVVSNDVDPEGWIGGLTGWMPNLSSIRNPHMEANAERITVSGDVVSADDASALRDGLAAAAADGQGTEMELSVYGGQRPSQAEITVRDGVVTINGEVDSNETVEEIKRAAASVFTGQRIDSNGLIANVEVAKPEWANNTGALLEEARIIGDGAQLELSDSRVVVAGVVESDEQKAGIINRVTATNASANVVDQLTVEQPVIEPEPQPDPEPAQTEVAKKLESLDLPNLQFEVGSAQLTADSVTRLDDLVGLMKEYPDTRIAVIGHTDGQGNPEYNLNLSRERAQSVVDYIVQQGIAADRLVAEGKGMTEPVASNDTEEGRLQNRRIEFSILD